jgi:uncharacterized protein (DUF2249 family)
VEGEREEIMTTIRPDMRIGELLKAHPELLDTLAGYAPAFTKLRNPLLRRTLGGMATLAQAASMGDVDLPDLLRTLREAAGEPTSPQGEAPAAMARIPLSAATPEPPAWLREERIVTEFDVRPLHAEGQNPIAPILKAAKTVPQGGILFLRNPFEPLPLYELLGEQGFAPWARQVGGSADDWEVFFYRVPAGEPVSPSSGSSPGPVPSGGEVPGPGEANVPGALAVASVQIDVSQLTPPEPMTRVLKALAQLQPGETLLVRHVQRPMYLFSKLDNLGHAYQTWEIGPGHVEILIRVGERE